MGKHLDRARELNREMLAAGQDNGKLITVLAGAVFAGAMALGMTLGLALPIGAPAAAYDVIEIHGEESDIVDYDVSFDDCLAIAQFSRADGRNIVCEVASN